MTTGQVRCSRTDLMLGAPSESTSTLTQSVPSPRPQIAVAVCTHVYISCGADALTVASLRVSCAGSTQLSSPGLPCSRATTLLLQVNQHMYGSTIVSTRDATTTASADVSCAQSSTQEPAGEIHSSITVRCRHRYSAVVAVGSPMAERAAYRGMRPWHAACYGSQ